MKKEFEDYCKQSNQEYAYLYDVNNLERYLSNEGSTAISLSPTVEDYESFYYDELTRTYKNNSFKYSTDLISTDKFISAGTSKINVLSFGILLSPIYVGLYKLINNFRPSSL